MHRIIATLLFTLALTTGLSPKQGASNAYAGAGFSTNREHFSIVQKTLPPWKVRAIGRIARIATRLEKVFPARHAPDSDDINGLAIASLCCGIGGLTIVPILGAVAAIVLGILALNKIRETGQSGKGLAIAGIIMGAVGLAIYLAYFLLLLALL